MPAQVREPCTVYVMQRSPRSALQLRIRGEFREMPGMRLKIEQAMRLWAIDHTTCQEALDDLVREGFLQRDDTGRYARAHSGY
jgi:DNA-binding GntR family transcriptional regulator